jgi:ribonuclease-3
MTSGQDAAALGHRFASADLLWRALTHRSAGTPHNERLEFLGDAVLNFLVAEAIYHRFPTAREGQLSRLRARLVNEDTLARVARSLALGRLLRLGEGELKSGGRERESILADALEAVLGAIYLDGGIQSAREVVGRILAPDMEALSPGEALKDPKTRLQEWLQGRGMSLPSYSVLAVEGEAHEQMFTVRCSVRALGAEAQARGRSRRSAEQEAAARLLEAIRGE